MKRILAGLALLIATPAIAADNLVVTPGAGATVKMRDSTGAGGPLVSYIIPADLTGTSVWGTAGVANANILTVQGIASMTPLLVTATQSGAWTVTQSGTWTVQPGNTANTTAWLVTGTGGTFPATQSGNWTMRNVGNAGAVLDFAGQNAASPANSFLVGGQFNTAPTTITTGNASPLQLDASGNLLVNVKAGGGAGGTSSSFGSAFPATGTAIGLATTSPSTGNMTAWAATTNYGTAPAAIPVPAVNANVTNANANGQTTMAASSPVTIASDQKAADPCMFQAKTSVPISTAAANTQLVAPVGGKKVYVCSLTILTPTAVSISLAEGTGALCNTANQAGMLGVGANGTAANGMPFAANGGMTYGNGEGTVTQTATTANGVCIFQSGTAQLAGNLSYVQQ